MPVTKTPAQIQADADAAAQAEAAKRDEDQRRQSGMFDWLKGLMPDFSFGGIFEMGLFAVIAYFVLKIPGVQNFLEKNVINHLSPEWQANVTGLLNKIGVDIDMGASLEAMDYNTLHTKLKDQMSPEILNIIDPNDNNKTLHSFLEVIRGANGGKVTLKGFTSQETITALLQQKPEMALALVTAAQKTGAGGKQSDTAQQVTASIKSLAYSSNLDKLLSPQNRANTIKILATALPAGTPISEEGLTTIITKGIIDPATGKPSDALRKLLRDAVDGNKAVILADVAAITSTKDLILTADATKMTGVQQYVTLTIQKDANAKAAQDALIAALGDAQASQFITALQDPNGALNAVQLLLSKENVHALPQAIALLNALPGLDATLPKLAQARQWLTPERIAAITNIVVNTDVKPLELASNFAADGTPSGQFSMDKTVDALLKPEVRASLQKAGLVNVAVLTADKSSFITPRNLNALLNCIGKLDTSVPSTKLVMTALAKVLNGATMKEAFAGMNGGQLAAFFSVQTNSDAFKALFDPETGITGSTPAIQSKIDLLRKDFHKGQGVGLDAIFSDKDSAQFLLDHDNPSKPSKYTSIATAEEYIFGGWMTVKNWNGALGIKANRDIIFELDKALTPIPSKSSTQIGH